MGEHLARERKPLSEEDARRLIVDGLKHNYTGLASACEKVQALINQGAGLELKALVAEFELERAEGLADETLGKEEDDRDDYLRSAAENFSMATVDKTARKNADFWRGVGVGAKIKRILHGGACMFCSALAGVYDYEEVKDSGNDVFRRHRNCHCQVLFIPTRGKAQDAHTKRYYEDGTDAMWRPSVVSSGAKNYIRLPVEDWGKNKEEIRRDKHAYRQYDAIKNSDQSLEKRKIYNNIGNFRQMKGFTKKDVDIAFDHVFNDLHELEEGIGLFRPDYDMAQSWSRLISGRGIEYHDLVLLRHERLEYDYMHRDGLTYQAAHDKTNLKFNYTEELERRSR